MSLSLREDDVKSLIEQWNGLGVVSRYDNETDSWTFVALHDDTLGRPVGGTRLRVYESPEDGLRDAMRLAEGMTHKWAALEFPFGGGKAVLALSRTLHLEERETLLRGYGRLLDALGDAFGTGEDLGTTPDDMLFLSRLAPNIHGIDRERGVAMDPGPYTARGVLAATHATANAKWGTRALSDRRILVQGTGDVGLPLVELLSREGARLIVSDIDGSRARSVGADFGAEVVDAEAVYETPCDIFAPCAVGGVLNSSTIPRLQCTAIAGSANNQLEDPSDADTLHDRGILYAPDYIANSGGALAFGSINQGVTDTGEIGNRLDRLEHSLEQIFQEADECGESPARAARRRVERVLADARKQRRGE